MKILLKIIGRNIRVVTVLAAILILGASAVQTTFAATTVFLDVNGTATNFWNGVNPVSCDTHTTVTWTTDPTGIAAPTVGATGDNFQFGVNPGDFNGANITFNTLADTLTGTNFSIVATNCIVTWASTGNSHFNTSGVTISVTTNSTLIWTTTANNNGYNFNGKSTTFAGAGTMQFQDAFLANGQAGVMVMNMPGGKVQLAQNKTSNYGATSGGSFTLTNGTLQFTASTALADAFAGFTAANNDTIKLNGGTIDNISGSDGTLNIGSGFYSIGGNFAYGGAGQNLSLGNDAVTLVVSPTITVNAKTLTIAGAIGDGGQGLGITNAGTGTLALTGANTYTGPTVASGGTLIASSASTGDGTYIVGDNATLDVSVGGLGQTLAMTNLTVGASAGGTLQFDFNLLANPNSTATAPIQLGASGTFTVNGTANQISSGQLSPISTYPAVIPLIAYHTAGGNLSSLALGTFPAASPAYQGYISNDTVNAVIDLVLTNGPIGQPPGNQKSDTWLGQTNGVAVGKWDATTTNWTSGGATTNYSNLTLANGGNPVAGDLVVFDDTLPGTTNVILTTTLIPGSITLNNNNSNYVFTGTGRISGAGSLTMSGTGSLMLDNSGNNDFSGGITINSGVLQSGNNDTNGNLGTGAIANSGGLVFNRTDTNLLINPVISGAGSLTNNGTGYVNLTAVETFTGATVVNAGTLAFSGPNSAIGGLSASSNLLINGPGTAQVASDNALAGNGYALPVTINAGGTLTGNPTSDAGAGVSCHLHGPVTINGGTLAMGGTSINTANGTWDLQGTPAITVPGVTTTSTMSALDMIPESGGGTVFNVTNGATPSGIDLMVSGSLINGTSQHDTGIIKNGNGLMVLDNTNTYAAGTTVNGGPLQLGMPADAVALTPVGPGPVSLTASATLNLNSGKGVTIAGAISDDNSGTIITVNGGTNIFGGVSTYTGKTIVNAGAKLVLTNGASINSSTLISATSAALDASTGGTISSSGTLSLTNSSLTLGTNLITSIGTLGVSNATLTFAIFPADQNTVNITVTGGFSTGGSTNLINLTAVPGYPVYPTNIVLIKYGTFGNVDVNNNLTTLGVSLPAAGAPSGYLTNDLANSSIDLVLLSDTNTPIFPVTWNGRTNGVNVSNWDILNTPDWLLTSDGVTPQVYQNACPVTFDDTAHGSTSVNLTTTVSPLSLTISNATKSYTFSGASGISGNVTLLKTNSGTVSLAETNDNFTGGISMGGGTLILSNLNAAISGGITVNVGTLTDRHSGTISGGLTVNGGSVLLDQTGTITGGTAINAGTVQVGNSDAHGVPPAGGITNNSALLFNRSDTNLNVTATISGSGAVTNNGTGTITLSATNTYTGETVVNTGIVILAAGNGAISGLHGSSLLTINSGAQVQVAVDNSLSGHGSINVLPILINAGGLLTGAPGTDAGAGTSTHMQGLLTLNGGSLTNSGTSLNAANGSWDLDDGVATAGGPVTSTIGCLDVVPSESGGEQFNVISGTTLSGVDLDVIGTIIHATSQPDNGIIKNGSGVMRMSSTNTYNSSNSPSIGTTINAGVLVVNAPEHPGVNGPLGATNAAQANLINFGGGTLRFSPTNNFDYSSRFGQGQPYSIDTAGQNVTFATAFIANSSLTKIGNGTLALTGANSYNGDTIAAGGKLITTTASTGAGNFTVTNGATVDVQVLAAGAQLTMANLTLGSNTTDTSTLQVDTLATGSPTAAPVSVTASVITNGTMNIALSGTALTAGTFPLISYAGSSWSSALHFIPPFGFSGALSDNNAGLISVTLNAVAVGPTTNANITKVTLSGTNLIIHGTNNNVPNTSFHYVVLMATNLQTPLSNWTPVVTNPFTGPTFDYTNPIVPGTSRQFIDVEAVP